MEGSANLGLCQLNDCLATSSIGEAVMHSQTALNWRFEIGLLHSVDANGNGTDRCLGPSVTTLDSDHDAPYGLILQDCPQTSIHANVFSHESDAPRTEQVEKEYSLDDGRHMRFTIVGDGRIQSLAPVDGRVSLGDSVFCMSSMNFGSVGEPVVYLVPCREGRKEQLFNIDAKSSFEPLLLNWQSADANIVEFAYQFGYPNVDGFESFAIKVSDGDSSFVSKTILPGGSSPDSGTLAFSLSDLGISDSNEHERLEAHLVGMSKDGLESRWLAGTTFTLMEPPMSVSGESNNNKYGTPGITDDDDDDDNATNAWQRIPTSVKTLFWFLCIMLFYVIVTTANNFFCPSNRTRQRLRMKKKKERLSELTAATVEEARRYYESAPNSQHSRSTISVDEEEQRDIGPWERSSSVEQPSNSQHSRSSFFESPPNSSHSRSALFRITEELDPEDVESIISVEEHTSTATTASTSGEYMYETTASRNNVETAE